MNSRVLSLSSIAISLATLGAYASQSLWLPPPENVSAKAPPVPPRESGGSVQELTIRLPEPGDVPAGAPSNDTLAAAVAMAGSQEITLNLQLAE